MKTYNIAIIGMGMISKSHAAAIGNLPNARCVAVVDCVEEKATRAGQMLHCPSFTDAKEMLEAVPEVEICILALPTYLHPEFVELLRACRKGRPVRKNRSR